MGLLHMISIIVPVLNEEAALPGFLGQFRDLKENTGFEIIICDGGSSDRTFDIAMRNSPTRAVRVIKAPKGRAKQMNEAARLATSDILLFLHADTYLPPMALIAIENSMQDRQVVAGRFKIRLDNSSPLYKLIGAMINIRDGLFGGFTGDQAIFIKRDVYDKLGGFKEIELCEDLDMARRLKKEGKVVQLPLLVTTAARRWEKRGPIKTILLMWLIRILFYAGVTPEKLSMLYSDVR